MISDTDARGHPTTYTYGVFSRVTQVTFPSGETRQFQNSDTQGTLNSLPPGTGTEENPAPAVKEPLAKLILTLTVQN